MQRQGRFSNNRNDSNHGADFDGRSDNYARKRNASEMMGSFANNRPNDQSYNNGHGEPKRSRFSNTDSSNKLNTQNNGYSLLIPHLAPTNHNNSLYQNSFNNNQIPPRPLFSNMSNFNRSNNGH